MGRINPSEQNQKHDIKARMRQAQYELVSKSALRAVPLNIVNALLLTAIIHPYVNTVSLWIWAGLLCVGPFLRFGAMLRARRADRAPNDAEMYLYIALSAVVGLAWGATPHLLSSNTPTLVSQTPLRLPTSLRHLIEMYGSGSTLLHLAYSMRLVAGSHRPQHTQVLLQFFAFFPH